MRLPDGGGYFGRVGAIFYSYWVLLRNWKGYIPCGLSLSQSFSSGKNLPRGRDGPGKCFFAKEFPIAGKSAGTRLLLTPKAPFSAKTLFISGRSLMPFVSMPLTRLNTPDRLSVRRFRPTRVPEGTARIRSHFISQNPTVIDQRLRTSFP